MIDPITAVSFSVYENKGTYALLLGSGVSRAANIPTGWEITLDLVRRVGLLQGAEEEADWSKWYQKKFKKEPSYSDLLASLATTPDQRRAILHSYIEPTEADIKEGRKTATKAHKAIAKLVRDGFIRVIITTNFDRLLENSLREIGIEPTIIKSADDIEGAVPLTHARCYIVKVHGDYLDTRIKNTEDELKSYSKKLNLILDRIFDEFGLIVCGWSSEWDEALRSFVSRAPNRRYSTYWAARGQLSRAAQDLVVSRAARVIEIESADDFFALLQSNVETQAALQGQDPRSVELLISSAKRFLSRAEDRIQLEELIGREIRLLSAQLDASEFNASGTVSDDRIQNTVGRYEAVTEPAARLFGILGRFGEGQEYKAVVHAIRNLALPEARSGLTIFNTLRSYPARLLLFGYGMGLIKAERYIDLFNLFSAVIGRDHREDTTVVGWPAPGSEDTKLGVLMEREVRHGASEIYAGIQA
jgi:hypothetical protein